MKWEEFRQHSRFFDFGETNRAFDLQNRARTPNLHFTISRGPGASNQTTVIAANALVTNEWCHLAAVSGPGGMQLYVNGVWVKSNAYTGSFAATGSRGNGFLGRSVWKQLYPSDQDFKGQMDEVRVWNVERSADQIRALMDQRLSGGESNLIALWNFDDGTARDATGRRRDGIFHGQAVTVVAQPALPQVSRVRAGDSPTSGAEPVLDLNGRNSYVELPPNIFNDLTEATVEGWVKWNSFRKFSRFFDFGNTWKAMEICNQENTNTLYFSLGRPPFNQQSELKLTMPGLLRTNEWCHIAAITGPGGVRLYFNGLLVATNAYPGSFSAITNGDHNYLGRSNWKTVPPGNDEDLDGQMDEVRVWRGQRSEQQIREGMFKSLTGREPGLFGLWNFSEVTNGVVRDSGPGGFDGRIFGGVRRADSNRPTVPWSTISGRVTDSKGLLVAGAQVFFTGEAGVRTPFVADASGRYVIRNNLPDRAFSLSVRHQGESLNRSNLVLQAAEYLELDLQLAALASLSGRVRSGQGKPLAGVLLRLLAADNSPTGRVVAVSLTHADGAYHFRGIEPGTYLLQAQRAAGFEGYQGGNKFEVVAGPSRTGFDFTLERAPLAQAPATPPLNRVLATSDGVNGGYVELPPDVFNELDEATIEGWVRWDSFSRDLVFYSYGPPGGGLRIKNPSDYRMLHADISYNGGPVRSAQWLESSEWTHVAWVTGQGGMKLYLNGALVSRAANTASFSSLSGGELHFLGKEVFGGRNAGSRLDGALDEVRVWATARTGEQIRGNMFRRLTGQEEGLAALWNFDDPNEPGRDASPHGFHGKLIGKASAQPGVLPAFEDLTVPLSVAGVATDKDGRVVGNSTVKLLAQKEGVQQELTSVVTDYSGKFMLVMQRGTDGRVDLSARRGDLTCPATEIPASGGENLTLVLRDLANLSGQVLARDDSPLPAVVVQAIPVAGTGRTTSETPGLWGEYFQLAGKLELSSKPERFPQVPAEAHPTSAGSEATIDFPRAQAGTSLGRGERNGDFYARWSGSLRLDRAMRFQLTLLVEDAGRVFVDGKPVIDLSPVIGYREKSEWLELTAGDHPVLIEFAHTAGRYACQLFWSADGRAREIVPASMLVHTPKFAPPTTTTLTDSRGRFRFIDLPPGGYTLRAHVPGGFAAPDVSGPATIAKDGAVTGVDFHLSPFKKGRWQHWTHAEGLPDDSVRQLTQDRTGAMWFATDSGITRFDGLNFRSWTAKDGLPDSQVTCVSEGEDGVMWLGTAKGLVRHEARNPGPSFTVFTTTNGLPSDTITALESYPNGPLWVGTARGLARFDGAKFEVVSSGGVVGDGVLMGNAKLVTASRPAGAVSISDGAQPMQSTTVLQTYGSNDFLRLRPEILANVETVTIEAWTRWNGSLTEDKKETFLRLFLGRFSGGQYININEGMGNGWKSLHSWITTEGQSQVALNDDKINFGKWNHIALVSGPAGMKLYRNGKLVSSKDVAFSFAQFGTPTLLQMGRLYDVTRRPEEALARDRAATVDEIRIWNQERTEAEISTNMYRNLSGTEPGLIGFWNFDQPAKAGPKGVHISSLQRETNGVLWVGTEAGVSRFDGTNWLNYSTKDGLAAGGVQAIHQARDGSLWFAAGSGVSHLTFGVPPSDDTPHPDSIQSSTNDPPLVAPKPGEGGSASFTTFTARDGLPRGPVKNIAEDAVGQLWFASGEGLCRFDGKSFIHFTTHDGMASERLTSVFHDADDNLWLASSEGVVRFSPQSLMAYGPHDGLDEGAVSEMAATSDGNTWFLMGQKLSRFDGDRWFKLAAEQGVGGGYFTALLVDTNGTLLVGSAASESVAYEPSAAGPSQPRFNPLLGSFSTYSLTRSSVGELWFTGYGVRRLGEPTVQPWARIGLVMAAAAGPDGAMWFGGPGGLYRWNGATMTNLSTRLANRVPTGLRSLPDGSLLVTTAGGLMLLDAKGETASAWPTNNSELDGLRCTDINRDHAGRLWLATAKGVYFTDGIAWSKLDHRDGLPEDTVQRVAFGHQGSVWFGGLTKGVARYQPVTRNPQAPFITVQADREYTELSALPRFTAGQRVTFRFGVVDYVTVPEKRQYRWQLFQGTRDEKELAANWQPPGPATQLEQTFAKRGAWTLALQFIDRDLNYSKPTLAVVNIALPWHANLAVMVPAGTGVLGLLGWAFLARLMYMRKRHEAERLREQLLIEEQKARQSAEEAKEAAEIANKAKSGFLANMSHELRTPLNAIIGYTEMVQDLARDDGNTDYVPDLEKVVSAAKHQLHLVNDILDLSKIEAGKMTIFLEEFDVTKLVNEVAATVQPLVAKKSNQLEVICAPDVGLMTADQTKVRQTLFNLLSNASKFTERGVIKLEIQRVISNQFSVISEVIWRSPSRSLLITVH